MGKPIPLWQTHIALIGADYRGPSVANSTISDVTTKPAREGAGLGGRVLLFAFRLGLNPVLLDFVFLDLALLKSG